MEIKSRNRDDPSAWDALVLDQSSPVSVEVREAWVRGESGWFRQYALPILRPIAWSMIALIQLIKCIPVLRDLSFPHFLHRLLVLNLKIFVSPEGNYILFRHFHLGSQVLEFLKANIDGVEIQTSPLYPEKIEDFADDLFIKHDVNLYNFIIDLNLELKSKDIPLKRRPQIDFSAIVDPPISVTDFNRGFFNFIDIESAIELFSPVFQFLLSDRVFWRSVHSLQFDEMIGIYFSKLFGMSERMFLVNNKHPLIPVMTYEAANRLVLHGVSTEGLHGLLMAMKKENSR